MAKTDKNNDNLIRKVNSGSTSHVPLEIWEELKKVRNTRDKLTGRFPTREEIQKIILDEGYQVSLKTIERRLPLINIKFSHKRSTLIKILVKKHNYYTENQIDRILAIVKAGQQNLNPYIVRFIDNKFSFEILEQTKEFNDRFPYDPIQQAWIDLYVSLELFGEWLGIEKECNEIRDLIERYRPWYFKNPKEFGYDLNNEDWLNASTIEKFKILLANIKTSMKMVQEEEYLDTVKRIKTYKKLAKNPTNVLIEKLRNKVYSYSIATPITMMREDDYATWVEELIGRLPTPTRPKKELITMRNEILNKRETKRTPEDFNLWNVIIKIFEQAESEV
tara:strand:- start:3369 stop:4370 length:1002 start_codon:yes stop_codon:yes gene_type:complete